MLLNIILFLSLIDLCLTHYYISKYKEWQPNKPYKKMEGNILLCFLFNKFGHNTGIIIGGLIIFILIIFVIEIASILISGVLFIALLIVIYRSINNICKLNKLIVKYPRSDLK